MRDDIEDRYFSEKHRGSRPSVDQKKRVKAAVPIEVHSNRIAIPALS
ncbi:hypothetical protein RMSM_04643 [Rhodopirellula maiorica SM1]|uniref:Uncharacterized protein n=1 Tax=Rhodopirellula maiorica SM1 TaxID=1265738 RepID=M5RWW2_9BACT|nr:hypothetical protein RMSM_04643 [Rhodopirellula maiorica SM1]